MTSNKEEEASNGMHLTIWEPKEVGEVRCVGNSGGKKENISENRY